MRLKIVQHHKDLVGQRVSGFIYDDERKKFADGCLVTTSPVQSYEDGILTTRSGSKYQVEEVSSEEWMQLCADFDY